MKVAAANIQTLSKLLASFKKQIDNAAESAGQAREDYADSRSFFVMICAVHYLWFLKDLWLLITLHRSDYLWRVMRKWTEDGHALSSV